jgi:hypothetical protein
MVQAPEAAGKRARVETGVDDEVKAKPCDRDLYERKPASRVDPRTETNDEI